MHAKWGEVLQLLLLIMLIQCLQYYKLPKNGEKNIEINCVLSKFINGIN